MAGVEKGWRLAGVLSLALALALSAAGCAGVQVGATLTDLESGAEYMATLKRAERNTGEAVLVGVGGERFSGTFDLTVNKVSENMNALGEGFGYGLANGMPPVGTATLTGNRGTTLQVILYELNPRTYEGAGVAIDDDGRRYRVTTVKVNR